MTSPGPRRPPRLQEDHRSAFRASCRVELIENSEALIVDAQLAIADGLAMPTTEQWRLAAVAPDRAMPPVTAVRANDTSDIVTKGYVARGPEGQFAARARTPTNHRSSATNDLATPTPGPSGVLRIRKLVEQSSGWIEPSAEEKNPATSTSHDDRDELPTNLADHPRRSARRRRPLSIQPVNRTRPGYVLARVSRARNQAAASASDELDHA